MESHPKSLQLKFKEKSKMHESLKELVSREELRRARWKAIQIAYS